MNKLTQHQVPNWSCFLFKVTTLWQLQHLARRGNALKRKKFFWASPQDTEKVLMSFGKGNF